MDAKTKIEDIYKSSRKMIDIALVLENNNTDAKRRINDRRLIEVNLRNNKE